MLGSVCVCVVSVSVSVSMSMSMSVPMFVSVALSVSVSVSVLRPVVGGGWCGNCPGGGDVFLVGSERASAYAPPPLAAYRKGRYTMNR